MMFNMSSSRDQHTLTVNLSMATNLWEMTEIVYLSHDQGEFCPHFSNLCARLNLTSLSWSLSIIFTSEFLYKNGHTIAFRTKIFANNDFSIHFGTMITTLPISPYMVQYLFESMFIYYICQI